MTPERGTKDVETRVYQAVRDVPSGFVTTYGDIARTVGLRSPRQVGQLLAKGSQPAPWHRVVRADGSLAEAVAPEQGRRLRAEGVDVAAGRVDLKKYRW